ncbi:MAG: YdcF family protein, partial [Acidobacteriota bacterium]|nr:YdcF family protein [Acidobacteriota bacterium]
MSFTPSREITCPAAAADLPKRFSRFRWAWLSALVLLAWPPAAWLAARVLVVDSTPVSVDAIAVLAGSSTYVERAHRAADLFSHGRAPFIVLTNDGQHSGWSEPEQRNPFFFERAMKELQQRGVPRERITVIAQPVTSTYEEAVALRAFAARNNLRSMLVVAGPYQSRRALRTVRCVFEGTGVLVGVDAPTPGEQSPSPSTWWLHRMGWHEVPSEYAKLAYYY